MTKITEKGVVVERLNDTIESLEKGFREIYGSNINLNPESPDGQMIGLIAQMKYDIGLLIQNNYQQLDPDLATGQWLEQRVAYGGIFRGKADYSYLRSVIITGQKGTKLFKNFSVTDENSNRWLLTKEVVIGSNGSVNADFRSENLGSYQANKNTILKPETIILGVDKVETFNDSELGEEVESDENLRLRFNRSHFKKAINSADSIRGNILDLADVKQAKILENNTNLVDENQVQPHTINCIVEGGLDKEIANAIYTYKGSGVGLQGSTQVILDKDDGKRLIKFDRPQIVDIKAEMTLIRYNEFQEIDVQGVKNALVNLDFEIGQDVYISRLFSTIQSSDGFYIQSLKIGKNGSLASKNVEIQIRELARFLESNIKITVA